MNSAAVAPMSFEALVGAGDEVEPRDPRTPPDPELMSPEDLAQALADRAESLSTARTSVSLGDLWSLACDAVRGRHAGKIL